MNNKEIGFIGLGRMGLNMATLLVEKGYKVVGYNRSLEARETAQTVGVEVVPDISSLVSALSTPKVVWLMVSSSAVDVVLDELTPLLAPGDTIVDGGNSFYLDSLRRHVALKAKELKFLDCGTSGGVDGARHGASIKRQGQKQEKGYESDDERRPTAGP